MGIFSKKSLADRIKPKWSEIKCDLATVQAVLEDEEEHNMEIWGKCSDVFFQFGTSSDYSDENGFFDKVYYINLSTDVSLFKLLNGKLENSSFFMSDSFDEMSNKRMFSSKSLLDIWSNTTIVGVSGGDPAHFPPFFENWTPERISSK